MANRSFLASKIIEECFIAGIKVTGFSYNADEKLKVWSDEPISNDSIDAINRSVTAGNLDYDMVRYDQNEVWVVF